MSSARLRPVSWPSWSNSCWLNCSPRSSFSIIWRSCSLNWRIMSASICASSGVISSVTSDIGGASLLSKKRGNSSSNTGSPLASFTSVARRLNRKSSRSCTPSRSTAVNASALSARLMRTPPARRAAINWIIRSSMVTYLVNQQCRDAMPKLASARPRHISSLASCATAATAACRRRRAARPARSPGCAGAPSAGRVSCLNSTLSVLSSVARSSCLAFSATSDFAQSSVSLIDGDLRRSSVAQPVH